MTPESRERREARDSDRAGRVLRPRPGGTGLGGSFRLSDVPALTEALQSASRGRIERVHGTATDLERELEERAKKGRRAIETALAEARSSIESRVREIAERADRVVERARHEAHEAGERAGYERGYAEGLARGAEEGRARAHAETLETLEERTASLVPTLASLFDELERERRELRECAHRDLLELAVTIAGRIVHREVEGPSPVVVDALHAAIDRIETRHGLTVELHPADRAAAEEYLGSLFGRCEGDPTITIVERSERARGGCRVWTECGCVDQTIETQFSLIEERLLGRGEVRE